MIVLVLLIPAAVSALSAGSGQGQLHAVRLSLSPHTNCLEEAFQYLSDGKLAAK